MACHIEHIGQERINRPAQEGLLGSLAKVDLSMCEPCLAGKAQKPFGKAIRAFHPLELIHSNICRPMNVRVQHGPCYFSHSLITTPAMAMYICFLATLKL